jgi:ankyrin repeat protein
VVPFDDEVKALAIRSGMSGLFVASGKQWGELRIESGTTPLTLACFPTLACFQGSRYATIHSLLQRGADVDQENGDGYTPLFVASSRGHVDAARLLLDAGASVDKRRAGEWSPFGIACVRGHLDVATLLVERGADTAALNTRIGGMPPLLIAYQNGDLDAMRLCLTHGADVNWANEDGETILYDACINGSVDAARLLLERGADVHKATNSNRTPLHAASYNGHIDVVRLLLANGADADIDREDKDGDTPLAEAKGEDYEEIVALLEDRL